MILKESILDRVKKVLGNGRAKIVKIDKKRLKHLDRAE